MTQSKNLALPVLVCLNLILITCIVLCSYTIPAAQAQNTSMGTDYMVVAGEIMDQHDALYLIDFRSRFLHVFYFDRGTKLLKYAGYRDLEKDFRHNRP